MRVAIAADSQVLRAGLASVLDGEEDMQIATSDEADVAIVVVRGGARETVSFRGSDVDGDVYHERPTLALLDRMSAESVRDTFAAGASAVLTIDASDEELTAALRAIAAGLVVMPASVSSELIASSAGAPTVDVEVSATSAPLTRRETEVLGLLAQGLANKVVAARLGITEATVKTHIAAVYEKLNARNRAEAVVAAARQGLITL
jgi:DNA-binding NarL/FixJ family response regulator